MTTNREDVGSPNRPSRGLSHRRSSQSGRPVTADIDVFGMTDAGKVRDKNDDQFLVASLHKLLRVQQTSMSDDDLPNLMSESRGYLFLVADGVGSRPGGQRASGMVVRTIAEYVTHFTDLYRRLDPAREQHFLQEVTRSVQHGHEALLEQAERDGDAKGLATTLTMVAVLWPRAYLVQVGDSRCYRLRQGGLERMSRDQTMAQALVDAGALTPDQAERSPLNNVLVSALGGKETQLMTATADCEWDDILMLCTDGLTKHVPDEVIRDVLHAAPSAEAACRELVQRALDGGGSDNVTVVVGRLRRRRRDTAA